MASIDKYLGGFMAKKVTKKAKPKKRSASKKKK